MGTASPPIHTPSFHSLYCFCDRSATSHLSSTRRRCFSHSPYTFCHQFHYHLDPLDFLRPMAILDLPHWGLLTTTLLSCLASPALSAPHQHGSNRSSAQPVRIPMGQSFHGPTWNLTYGSPPQTMVMLDDWTWQSTWLYSPNCKGSYSVPNCVLPGQNFFDYEKSSSFHQTSDAVQSFNGTDYAPGLPFTFNFGTDKMCLPDRNGRDDICKSKIEVEISDLPYKFPVVEDIGGIFGYSPVLTGFNATFFPAPYQFMQAGLLSKTVGWHMCTALKNKRSCSNQDYLTILGGTDTSVYHPRSMQDHPIVVTPCINAGNLNLSPARDNYWSASWTGLWMGNTATSLSAPSTGQPPVPDASCNSISPVAIFDEGGFGKGAPIPLAAFPSIVTATGAIQINESAAILNQGKQGLYSVSCSKISTFPTLTYELSGKQNITVTPDMYIDTTTMPGSCLLNARAWDRTTAGAQTFFGITVIERTYLKFDYERLTVGVAPLNHNLF